MIEISVVIPVYNSFECLSELCRQISDHVMVAHEIILVNDNSSDNSWDEICKLSSTNNSVKGVSLRKNFGQDNAIMAGLSLCVGKYVVIMDDDLQHSPKDIPLLYDACRQGLDVCYGSYYEKKQTLWKNIGSWLNGKVSEWMLAKPADIYLSPFKILNGNLVDSMLTYSGPFPYIDGLILSHTDKIGQIKVVHSARFAGTSTYSFRKSVSVWLKHVTGFSVVPLRVASVVGVLSSLVGFSLAGFHLFKFFFISGVVVEGWTTLVELILVIGGLSLLSLGIIGEYLGRSYLLLNSKPQYSIGELTFECEPNDVRPLNSNIRTR